MDHHPHITGVAIDLHLDEVVAAADGPELRNDFLVRAVDALEIRVLRDFDVLSLAHIGIYADRLRAVAEDLIGLRDGDSPCQRGALRADTGRDPRFDLANPRRARIPIGHAFGRKPGYFHVEHAARDVVARARLNDRRIGHHHAPDGDAVADVRVGHEVRADDAFVGGCCGELRPHRLLAPFVQRIGKECVGLDLHLADAGQDVVVVGDFFDRVLEGHGTSFR
jgi:hypothetical protein